MATWDGNNYYYSGQGVVLIGTRDSAGKPKNLLPVGNVSALSIAIEEEVLEHKESQTGSRTIDLRLSTEVSLTASFTLENFIAKNLALTLRGDDTDIVSSSVTGEVTAAWYPGAIIPLEYSNVSSVVIDNAAATALTAYTNDTTPYDYKLNADAGSIEINDGSVVALATIADGGTAVTNLVEGATTSFDLVGHTASVGEFVVITGVTGTGNETINDLPFEITAVAGDTITIAVDTSALTLTETSATATYSSEGLVADYSYAAQKKVDAVTKANEDFFLRFEGLNTADTNKNVTVEIFRFSASPLSELALIGDEVQQFEVTGNVISDDSRSTGSKFFKINMER